MIYKKLFDIGCKVRGLSKDATAYNYKYVSGDKLLSVLKPLMQEQKLLLLPEVTEVVPTPNTYKKYDRGAKAIIETTEILYQVTMRMTWVDVEDGETLVQAWAASGMNGFDKGFGSALTYGERYYFLKLFHLATDEDDVDAVSKERDEAIEKALRDCPYDEVTLRKMVAAHATGQLSKDGKTSYRDIFIKANGNADYFDAEVELYKSQFTK